MHLEEAGILRAGPGGPDQQWPTVSSATPGKDPRSLFLLGSRRQSDDLFVCFFKIRNANGFLFSLSSFPYMHDFLILLHDYFDFLLNVLQELKTEKSARVYKVLL